MKNRHCFAILGVPRSALDFKFVFREEYVVWPKIVQTTFISPYWYYLLLMGRWHLPFQWTRHSCLFPYPESVLELSCRNSLQCTRILFVSSLWRQANVFWAGFSIFEISHREPCRTVCRLTKVLDKVQWMSSGIIVLKKLVATSRETWPYSSNRIALLFNNWR